MSTTVDTAKNHRIFLVEMRGSTLIVTPRGDAVGFSGVEFHREKNAILKMLDSPEVNNLIVDLGGANYFGSDTIGAVNSLVVKTRDQGGRYGVCGLSEDMEEGIRIMNLEELWHVYSSRAEALRAVRSESWLTGLRLDFGTQVMWALLIVLGCTGVWALITQPWHNPDRDDYQVLSGIMDQYVALQKRDAPPPEMKVFTKQAVRTVEPIRKRLKRTARAKYPAKLYLFWAADRMPEVLSSTNRDESDARMKSVRNNLETARRYIDGELSINDSPSDEEFDEDDPAAIEDDENTQTPDDDQPPASGSDEASADEDQSADSPQSGSPPPDSAPIRQSPRPELPSPGKPAEATGTLTGTIRSLTQAFRTPTEAPRTLTEVFRKLTETFRTLTETLADLVIRR